jgi:type IV pilus assembly protein PilB
MGTKRYMNFDEAVEFLGTTRSTLYKWMQAGKVPGHKLGRQWRFLEAELLSFGTGTEEKQKLQKSLSALSHLLTKGKKKKETPTMNHANEFSACEVAEQLIWDATNSGANGIHFQPKDGRYEIAYRGINDLERLSSVDKATFHELNSYYQQISSPIKGEDKRRFFLGKKMGDGKIDLHIRYQQLETVTGSRVTLKISRSDHIANSLKVIAKGRDLETLERWCSASHGIVVFSGCPGSGKTTSIHCAIHDLVKNNRVVFTIEDPVEFVIEGANQVEVDMRSQESVKKAFDSIYDSDLDVLCLGLSSNSQSESEVFKAARQAASSGHLVLLQLEEGSPQSALEELQKQLGESIESLIVGISCQKLVENSNGVGRHAEYELVSGALDPKV